ncbi:hypothetical protein ANCDUO_04047 [Ancylostoma duodenale]|uniref:Uncharacterized protein n=1 Tax=Ancylostoma duodenale TaxID=51022 RepID=A0A0C2H214_9BILA|nr:hypothetical protein ANCDUO_04047 [Ancylostoma duodenale]
MPLTQFYGPRQAVPQKDPDEENEPSWRITVNPSAELFGSQRLRQLIDRLYHQQKLLSATDAKQVHIFDALLILL